MTKINADQRAINVKDVIQQALAFRNIGNPLLGGVEAERFLLCSDGRPATRSKYNRFFRELVSDSAFAEYFSREPASYVIEMKSPDAAETPEAIMEQFTAAEKHAGNIAKKRGLIFSRYSGLENLKHSDVMENYLIEGHDDDGEPLRQPMMVKAGYEAISREYSQKMAENWVKYSAGTTSMQYTNGVRDAEDLWRKDLLFSVLSPLMMAIFHNRESSYDLMAHQGVLDRMAIQDTSLTLTNIPAFVSDNAQDYIEGIVEGALNKPLWMYKDKEGKDVDCGHNPVLFRELPLDLQTVANFNQAMAQRWHATKVKILFNDQDDPEINVTGLLLETRDMDYSAKGVPVMVDLMHRLFRDDNAQTQILQTLEDDFDLPILSNRAKAYLEIGRAYQTVASTYSEVFLDIPFGSTGKTMRDFVKDVLLKAIEPKQQRKQNNGVVVDFNYGAPQSYPHRAHQVLSDAIASGLCFRGLVEDGMGGVTDTPIIPPQKLEEGCRQASGLAPRPLPV